MSTDPESNRSRVAWYVELNGTICVTFAEAAAAARWSAVHSWRDAGFGRHGEWPSVKAWRAPDYDRSTLAGEAGRRCYAEEYVLGTVGPGA